MYLPNPRDLVSLAVFDEIYLIKIYGDADLTGRFVIDIGASVADTALYFGKCGAKVFRYETDHRRYSTALENVKLNGMKDKVTIFHKFSKQDIQSCFLISW